MHKWDSVQGGDHLKSFTDLQICIRSANLGFIAVYLLSLSFLLLSRTLGINIFNLSWRKKTNSMKANNQSSCLAWTLKY